MPPSLRHRNRLLDGGDWGFERAWRGTRLREQRKWQHADDPRKPLMSRARYLLAAGLVCPDGPCALNPRGAAAGDAAAAMAQYRQALEEYNRARQIYAAAAQRLLGLGFGKAQIAQCQARARRTACDRRLCARSAAGLYRAAEAAQSVAARSAGTSRLCSGGCRFSGRGEQEFKFSPRLPQNDSEFKRAYAKVAPRPD